MGRPPEAEALDEAGDHPPRLPMMLPKERRDLVGLGAAEEPREETEPLMTAWACAEGEMGGALAANWPEKRRA